MSSYETIKREQKGSASLIIRPFDKTDAQEINELHEATIRTINSADYTPEQINAWVEEVDTTYWISTFQKTNGLVATDDHDRSIVGFGDVSCCKKAAELQRLYVRKDRQGRGIGKALLSSLEAIAQGRGLIEINVNSSITAGSFYTAQGYTIQEQIYVPMGRRSNILVPAIRMYKQFKQS